jgi:hydrogenase expression/formation protein HypE
MCGAKSLYLSAGFILEEGLEIDVLRQVVASMAATAREAGVRIITGDTKVVERGKADQMFINTSGVGTIESDRRIGPREIKPGDKIILSGDIGRHGIAVMALREGLTFETTIQSDCASLNGIVDNLMLTGVDVHCMRDLTRGGLASALVEIAGTARRRIHIDEERIPVGDAVAGACEILGLDPMFVANEGRFIAIVATSDVDRSLATFRTHSLGAHAQIIGEVRAETDGLVTMTTSTGVDRVIEMFTGEQLPRIC